MRAPTTGTSLLAEILFGTGCLTGDLTVDLTGDLTGDLIGVLFDLTGDEGASGDGIAGVALYINAVSSNLDIWLRSRLMSPCSTCNPSIITFSVLRIRQRSHQTINGKQHAPSVQGIR